METVDQVPLNRDTVDALMRALGIDSYAELAKRAGLERSYVSRVMRRERPALPSHVIAFSRALMVKPIVLLGPADPDQTEADVIGAAS